MIKKYSVKELIHSVVGLVWGKDTVFSPRGSCQSDVALDHSAVALDHSAACPTREPRPRLTLIPAITVW